MFRQVRGSVLRVTGALLPFALIAATASADGPAVSGYVESNYVHSFMNPKSGTIALRTYDAQDKNINNNAHLEFNGSLGDNVAYSVQTDIGHDAPLTMGNSANDPNGTTANLQEAFVSYTSLSKIGFKVGKFVTYEGIEVIENPANPTISRGYLFGWAEPFTHVGGVLTYQAGNMDFAAGVVNGWDVPNDNNRQKTWVGKVGLNCGDPLTATLSGYYGDEQPENRFNSTAQPDPNFSAAGKPRSSIDLTVLTKLIPNVDLNLQGNYGYETFAGATDGKWSGVGVQPVVKINKKVSIGARAEYFNDKGGSRTGVANLAATNYTITPQYKFTDNVAVRAEYRYDRSNKDLFQDDKGALKKASSTMGLQAYVTF